MEDKTTKPRGTTDRISDLPQPIIHHILSFLPKNNVVKGLSKTWYGNWTSSPYLDFDDFNHHNKDNHVNFITRTLQRFHDHNLQIRRLTIPLQYGAVAVRVLDSWITLALQHGVEELNLEIYRSKYDSYHLPPAIFDASSIKVAKFVGFSNLLQSIPHDDRWPSFNLLKLCLDKVVLDELTLSSIISRCPLIEDLSIINCNGMNCVQISSLQYLKTLQISDWRYEKSVQIDAPSLQSLDVRGLVTISILESPNLLKLCLEYVQLDEVILCSIFSSCPLIKDLSIISCRSINCVRIPNLHKLKALQIISWTGDLTVEIDAPCLQSLHILGPVKIDILECPMLTHLDLSILKEFNLQHILSSLSLLCSLCLSNMSWLTKLKVSSNILKELKIFDCYSLMELEIDAPNLVSGGWGVSNRYGSFRNPYMVEDFAIELSNFVSKAKHLKYLCLQFKDQVKPFIFNEVNERVDRPVANIDHLELRISTDFWMSEGYLDLFDGLLWSCHPRTLSLKYSYISNYYYNCVVKCMLRIIASHRHSCSCTLARSWLHHLEDVTYVSRYGGEEQLPMDENHLRSDCKEIKFHFKW